MAQEFDAIIVGSGISGGWAAKEFCEKGFKTLLIERGRNVEAGDYPTENKAPWEFKNRGRIDKDELNRDYKIQRGGGISERTKHFFIKDPENPYGHDEGKPFSWIRGHQLGGKSLTWGKVSLRLSDLDFSANAKDGHGSDWPIRYKDIAPWYDYVETFAGISGSKEGLDHLPDGIFQPPMELSCIERHAKEKIETAYTDRRLIISRTANLTEPTSEQLDLGRSKCQFRNECMRGCSFGAYFSSQSATLPAAERTGNLTIVTDAVAQSVTYDEITGKAVGVRIIDAHSKQGREYKGKVIFLCASTLGSTQILLNSTSEKFKNGLANSSGVLGHYLMDHIFHAGAKGKMTGLDDRYYSGRRPNGVYIPRFRNVHDTHPDFLRGYGYEGWSSRMAGGRGSGDVGHGADFKKSLQKPGDWQFEIMGFGEMLPRFDNHVRLDRSKLDQWSMPLLHVSCCHSDNEKAMQRDMMNSAAEMLEISGLTDIEPYMRDRPPGHCIHEMGTARMGNDPNEAVLNKFNQCHDVANLFVTDGAAMVSSACQNPSLTYMALTARAVDYAASQLKAGLL